MKTRATPGPSSPRNAETQQRDAGNYAWEETEFPPQYAADFNATLDLITVVSNQTRDLLQNAGVNYPNSLGRQWHGPPRARAPQVLPCALQQGYRFLHISSVLSAQRASDVLLRAYGNAYRAWHDVVLIVKTFPNPTTPLRKIWPPCGPQTLTTPTFSSSKKTGRRGKLLRCINRARHLCCPAGLGASVCPLPKPCCKACP